MQCSQDPQLSISACISNFDHPTQILEKLFSVEDGKCILLRTGRGEEVFSTYNICKRSKFDNITQKLKIVEWKTDIRMFIQNLIGFSSETDTLNSMFLNYCSLNIENTQNKNSTFFL